MLKQIKFSPPDIGELEIESVVQTLKSGWITTGNKTKQFEEMITTYCGTTATVCLNSATDALELVLRFFGIGPGDEVITSAYTYSASGSVIDHVGAKIILCDTVKDSYFMDYDQLERLITPRTKAIIPVDIAGLMADYDRILAIVNSKKAMFEPATEAQENLGRILVLADAAHSIGALYKNKASGTCADITCFSFHAVKNVTTAEGGAITWKSFPGYDHGDMHRYLHLLSNHGQSKTAEDKLKLGNWEYDIVLLGYKCNMTDITASLGMAQLQTYPSRLRRRRQLIQHYNDRLASNEVQFMNHLVPGFESSGHLYILRLVGKDEVFRNELIEVMAEQGVPTNVHYKPLPMMTAYKALGFDIADYPNAFNMYRNSLTLPLHTLLTDEDADYIIDSFWSCYDMLTEKAD